MKRIIDNELENKFIDRYKIKEILPKGIEKHINLFFFEKGEFLCREDEKLKYIFFFVKGKAKVCINLSNGKSLLVCFYEPFKVLGDLELINKEEASSNIQAIEDTYCIGIPLDIARKDMVKDTDFMTFICTSLGEKLKSLSRNSSINLLYPLENRLASYIKATEETRIIDGENEMIFKGNLNDTSELLGISYRHLLRVINKFCENKIIEKKKGYYRILNHKEIEELAMDLYR